MDSIWLTIAVLMIIHSQRIGRKEEQKIKYFSTEWYLQIILTVASVLILINLVNAKNVI